ncbi:hypothetical protein [Maribacter sp. 2307ULW6-5]|uniref:hypothetical protein n=1 Tax=Maribacter sp. 2307ULW6-5 TaxID=3386275 RepID=UPI0039BD915C
MTDELELLKRDWQKKDAQLPKLSYTELRNLIWKRSSSIVKWIWVISILEFSLPHLLYLLPSVRNGEGLKMYDNMGIGTPLLVISIVYYVVALYFIVQFYRRFKEISVLDNSKKLMRNIINTRRTVKHYIVFSLSTIVVSILVILFGFYITDDFSAAMPNMAASLQKLDPQKIKVTLMVSIGAFGLILLAVVGTIYFLLYGLLLRKLKKNYAELRSMEL